MNKTKKKIIKAAIRLFNEKGIANVRNQDIAKEASISLSNFNYHYKTKQDLVFAVTDYMAQVLEAKVYGNSVLIREGSGLEITRNYFEFEHEFCFFYLDTYNIFQSYPEVKAKAQRYIKEAIQMIKNLNYMAIGRGFMKPEPADFPGLYDLLAEQIWMNNHFWFAQMSIRGEEDNTVLRAIERSFAIMYPYLTERGVKGFRQYLAAVKEYAEKKATVDG